MTGIQYVQRYSARNYRDQIHFRTTLMRGTHNINTRGRGAFGLNSTTATSTFIPNMVNVTYFNCGQNGHLTGKCHYEGEAYWYTSKVRPIASWRCVSTCSEKYYSDNLSDVPLQTFSRILKIECADANALPYQGLVSVQAPGVRKSSGQ